MDIAIHINPSLPHQVEHGQRFKDGFRRHGIVARVTHDPAEDADFHVISGCWFAYRQWKGHPRTLWLDRCYYRGNPQHVSIGWMRKDGGREFREGCGRAPPVLKDRKSGGRIIYLADYDERPAPCDVHEIRHHPARAAATEPLEDALARHHVAVGYLSTALVEAALEGLEVHVHDDRHIMARPDWVRVIPYADWHLSEISSGAVWEHFRHDRETNDSGDNLSS